MSRRLILAIFLCSGGWLGGGHVSAAPDAVQGGADGASVTTHALPGAASAPAQSDTRVSEPALPRVSAPQPPRPPLPAARSRVEESAAVPAARPAPGAEVLAQAAPAAAAAGPTVPPPADVPPAPRFDITRFDVHGNTVLSAQDIDDAVGPYTGKSKDFADVQRALEALQLRYQARGYGAVQVLLPEQELERGVIVLRVIEPKVGRVAIEGNKFFDDANIRRSLPSLKEGTVPNAQDIGQEARVANENPAKRTTVLLRSGQTEGEVNATVRVQDERPWRAVVSLDNTGTPATGNYRLGFAYQHSNIGNRDHTLTLQYLLDPEPFQDWDNLKILGVGYRIPLYGRSASIDLLGGYSSLGTASAQVIQGQAFSIAGSGTFAGVRYNLMLPRPVSLDNYDHRLSLGVDYKSFSSQVQLIGTPGNLVPEITVYPVSLTYAASKKSEVNELSFYASVVHNPFPHGPDANDEKFNGPAGVGARPGVGRPKYLLYRYGANFVQILPRDWQLRMNATAQWTRDALIPGEQFGIGGWDSLRGMHEREAAADRGWRSAIELYTPDVGRTLPWDGVKMRLLAFLDSGNVRLNHTQDPALCLGNTSCGLSATSIGIGMRVATSRGVSLRLDWGHMLDAGAEGDRWDNRIHFGLAVAF